MTHPHLHLILNPRAGHRKARSLAGLIESELQGLGLEVTVAQSNGPGHITELALQAADAGHRNIAIAGGDGSLCEAVNGLMRSQCDPALGVIPVGTGNDFVKTAGLARDWRQACRDIADTCHRGATLRRVDVGACNGHYFLNCLGIGLDARIAMEANRLKHFGGRTVYLLALLRTLFRGIPRPRARIESEERTLEQPVSLVSVCNGQVVGSTFRMAPRARIDDGRLDVVVARGVTRFQVLRLAHRVIAGTHEGIPLLETFTSQRLSVHLAEPTPVEIDGEVISEGAMALDIHVIPGGLALLAPAD